MPRKKQYQIVELETQKMKSINIDGRVIPLRKTGVTPITDSGLAKEIDARMGHRARGLADPMVAVAEVDHQDPTEERGFAISHRVPDLSRFKGWAEAHTKRD